MKPFAIKLIPFFAGAAFFWLLGWYQANFHAQEGDLVRTSFLITDRHYANPEPIPTARDSTPQRILLVGDSHLDVSPSNRRFQNHLNTAVSAHSHWSYQSPSNPFSLGLALSREQKPALVVFEVVERNLVFFAQEHLCQGSIPKASPKTNPLTSNAKPFSHLGNGLRTAATLLNIQCKWMQNDQSRTIKAHKDAPLHSNDHILLSKFVWERRKPTVEVNSIVDSLQRMLTNQMRPLGAEFIIYIIPDKATVYSDFLDCSDLHPSWLLNSAVSDNIHSPVHSLREAVQKGAMEVYKYSDTHMGVAGARITGIHLNGILEKWQEANPNMSAPP